jgi:dolichol kinase
MIMPLVIALLIIGLGLLVLELLTRYTKISENILRKIVHVGLATSIIALSFIINYKDFISIGLVVAIVLVTVRGFVPLKTLSKSAKRSFGEILFPIGVIISAVASQTMFDFIAIIAILGYADTVAYVIGTNVKSPKLLFNKSVAGSLGFMIVTFGILLLVVAPLPAIGIAVLLTVTEALSPFGSDNIFVPIVASILLLSF